MCYSVAWECITRSEPWPDLNQTQTVVAVTSGNTLPIPTDCPTILPPILVACFDVDPAKRPSFQEIYDKL